MMEIYGRDFFPDLGIKYSADFTLYEPKGCPNCNNTGYKGRMGVHELLTGTDEVKRAVQTPRPDRRAPQSGDAAGDAHAAPGRAREGDARGDGREAGEIDRGEIALLRCVRIRIDPARASV